MNNNNDNWDEITDLLKNRTPSKPKDSVKNAAISKAMAEFEKKHSQSH